jgi:multimeric flavodoxin WrbA
MHASTMHAIVISASPNKDGLTAACAAAAVEGICAGGGLAVEVRLNDLKIEHCRACEDGWGTCRNEHRCQVEDDFQALHAQVVGVDALVLVTPVYWGDLSESAKAFTDRLRRCEATRGDESLLSAKPVIIVAAAGGTGGGMISSLLNLERWIAHVRARTWDLIPVNRWSRDYKLVAIRAAAEAMARERN